MRRPLISGNWKMNTLIGEARSLAKEVAGGLAELAGAAEEVDVLLGPPYLSLPTVAETVAGSSIGVAGQDCSPEEAGAFTGEVSAAMLKDAGATHVILGHSERRALFGETDQGVNEKVHAALKAGLGPIVCVGESLEEREADETIARVSAQVRAALQGVEATQLPKIVLAYEPIWAIGTGRTATPKQAQQVHAQIRALLAELYDKSIAARVRIQYGGSVKPENAAELLGQPDIDGALVGGASLKVASFVAIVQAACEAAAAAARD